MGKLLYKVSTNGVSSNVVSPNVIHSLEKIIRGFQSEFCKNTSFVYKYYFEILFCFTDSSGKTCPIITSGSNQNVCKSLECSSLDEIKSRSEWKRFLVTRVLSCLGQLFCQIPGSLQRTRQSIYIGTVSS